jgi:hypothetical protein
MGGSASLKQQRRINMDKNSLQHFNKSAFSLYFLFTTYLVWVVVGLYYHEYWRDETHSWLIASSSQTLPDLWYNIRYEGHPIGWYFLLWCGAKIYPHVLTLGVVQVLSAGSLGYIFIFKSPFSLLLKVLILFGGILGYEYGIIARNYSTPIFLLFWVASLYPQRPKKLLTMLLLLALAAQFNIFATIFSMAFAMVLCAQVWFHKQRTLFKTALAGAAIFCVSGAFFVATVYIKKDFAFIGTPPSFQDRATVTEYFVSSLSVLGLFAPTIDLITHFGVWFSRGVLGIILVLLFVALRRSFFAQALLLLSIVGISIFVFAVPYYVLTNRHCGIWLAVVLVCIWVGYHDAGGFVSQKYALFWLCLVGVLHFLMGTQQWLRDLRQPFSHGKSVAQYLQKNAPIQKTILAGYPDSFVSVVSAYLDQDMYHFAAKRFKKYPIWQKKQADIASKLNGDMLRQKCDSLAKVYRKNVFLTIATETDTTGIGQLPSAVFDSPTAELRGEMYQIYVFEYLPKKQDLTLRFKTNE